MAAEAAGDDGADRDWAAEDWTPDWACLPPLEPRDEDDDWSDPLAGPDGDDPWLAGLPPGLAAELAAAQGDGPWTGAGEAIAAGFLHHADGPAGAGWAAGGTLDRLEPGPALALCLAQAAAGLAGLGESELIGVLCAGRRQASWAAAQETEAVITLARRRAAQARDRNQPNLIDHVGDELAAALRLTGRSGTRLLDVAAGLARLDSVRAALAAGVIDWPCAVIFADELVALPDADARAVAGLVLPRAGEMTTGQLRAALRRAVEAADPAAARRRRQAARRDTGVHLWDETSGNCALAGRELPPAEAILADQWLTAQARWLAGRGAGGTLEQLRAAVYIAVLNGRTVASLLPPAPDGGGAGDGTSDGGADRGNRAAPGKPSAPGSPAAPEDAAASGGGAGPGNSGACGDGAADDLDNGAAGAWAAAGGPDGLGGAGAPGVTGAVNLTMPLTAWLGTSDAPGEVPGFGTADADTCRELAARLAAHPATRWCLTITDRDGHAIAHACARHGPGPLRPSSSPRPPDAHKPPGSSGPPDTHRPPGSLRPPGSPGSPGAPGSPGPANRTDAAAARWLASLRPARLESGDCRHRLRVPGYRPPRSLRHLIAVRQRTCGFPGCRRPATRCDDDHTIPWDQGGPTCACNLSPLCRHHHRAKQVQGWQLSQPEPGMLRWTLPHGRTYTTTPEPYPT